MTAETATPELGKPRYFCTAACKAYGTEATFFIQDPEPGRAGLAALRVLVVQYANGRREVSALIPADWSEEEIQNLILWPMKHCEFPSWEYHGRVGGSPVLYRYWRGEKPV
jgi:hypothetical protein